MQQYIQTSMGVKPFSYLAIKPWLIKPLTTFHVEQIITIIY